MRGWVTRYRSPDTERRPFSNAGRTAPGPDRLAVEHLCGREDGGEPVAVVERCEVDEGSRTGVEPFRPGRERRLQPCGHRQVLVETRTGLDVGEGRRELHEGEGVPDGVPQDALAEVQR